jgi:hypothetical protein
MLIIESLKVNSSKITKLYIFDCLFNHIFQEKNKLSGSEGLHGASSASTIVSALLVILFAFIIYIITLHYIQASPKVASSIIFQI